VANCPECGTPIDIDVDEVEEGEILSCPECHVELEVVNTNPLELDVISEEEEEEEVEEGPEADEDYPDEEEDNGLY
jgi:alpha-aminoadipate carrier protein LysW